MLVVVCVFSYIMLAIITMYSNLQAFDDLLVLYNEYRKHELE